MGQLYLPPTRAPVKVSPREQKVFSYTAVGNVAPANVVCTVLAQDGTDITNTVMPGGSTGSVAGLVITLPLMQDFPPDSRLRVNVLFDDPPEKDEDYLLLEVGT